MLSVSNKIDIIQTHSHKNNMETKAVIGSSVAITWMNETFQKEDVSIFNN